VVLIHEGQERDWWWADVNMVMNMFHKRYRISLAKNECPFFISLCCTSIGDLHPHTTGLLVKI
jgi:hypothetical protein